MTAILENASAHIDDLSRIAEHAGSTDFAFWPHEDQLICHDIDQAALDNAVATLPPLLPEVPTWVYPFQARKALLAHDLLDAVNAAVATAGGEAQIAWEYAIEIHRDSPLIESLGSQLGLTSEQIDALFLEAQTY